VWNATAVSRALARHLDERGEADESDRHQGEGAVRRAPQANSSFVLR
jgi:hypothetical protein